MSQNSKHLVIFGSGYVGGTVARQALGRGGRVTALTRNPETAAALARAGVDVVVAELANDAWHPRIVGPVDYILDTVGAGGGGLDGYRRSYVDGMASIVRWARTVTPVETFVYTSSTSVYPQDGGATVTESAPAVGVHARGRLLLEAEAILRRGAEATAGPIESPAEGSPARSGSHDDPPLAPARRHTGPPPARARGRAPETTRLSTAARGYRRAFILRIAGIYGPGRHALLDQVRSGLASGTGGHRLNLAHRDDICRAIWACFEAPAGVADDVFNVADDAPAPRSEVVAWLAARLGQPLPAPGAGRSGGPVREPGPDRVISNARLKRTLGWSPQYPSFREGYENILSRAAE